MTQSTDAQIHIRVSSQFKRAVKVFCAREGLTEQQWAHNVLEAALLRQAPDLDVGDPLAVRATARKGAKTRTKASR
jgi:hypothetical protein